jgi:hypothetical protein
MQSNFIRPHLIYLSEHHMREQEIINFSLNNCRLAWSFCREEFSNGGVCILTRNDINFNTIDLIKFCSNKTFEIRATKLNTKNNKNHCILRIQKLLVVLGSRPDHRYTWWLERQVMLGWINCKVIGNWAACILSFGLEVPHWEARTSRP